jgi:tetratricopeptide (TPR) repeat protein
MFGTVQKPFRFHRVSCWICGVPLILVTVYLIASAYFHSASGRLAARAELEVLRGELTSARRRLVWILWFHPQNPRARLAMGKVERAVGANDKAIDCFRLIPSSNEFHPLASFHLARSLALDGQLTEAEAELERYMGRYDPTKSVWDLFFRLLYLQTRTRDVIALLERKLDKTPSSLAEVRFLLKAEFVPQDPADSLDALEEIHGRHPDDVNVKVALAIALSRGDQRTRSEPLLRSVLERQPDNHRARIVLGNWLADRQEFLMAKECLWQQRGYPAPGEATVIAQDDRFWSLSSLLALQDGKIDLALQYIDSALQINPNDKQYLSQRAQVLRRFSNKEEANAATQKSVEAGEIEQDLFLLARQFENRPIIADDCRVVSSLYRRLGRTSRAELWERLAAQIAQMQGPDSALQRTTVP